MTFDTTSPRREWAQLLGFRRSICGLMTVPLAAHITAASCSDGSDGEYYHLPPGRIRNPINWAASIARKRISHYRLVQLLSTDRQVYPNLIFPKMVLPDWALAKTTSWVAEGL